MNLRSLTLQLFVELVHVTLKILEKIPRDLDKVSFDDEATFTVTSILRLSKICRDLEC